MNKFAQLKKACIFVPTITLKHNTMTNLELNNLLDNNIEVYWRSKSYQVKREESGNLIVVCDDNGFTSGLTESELEDCGINKWDMREKGLTNFKLIS
mgnify:CR=1 FL=1